MPTLLTVKSRMFSDRFFGHGHVLNAVIIVILLVIVVIYVIILVHWSAPPVRRSALPALRESLCESRRHSPASIIRHLLLRLLLILWIKRLLLLLLGWWRCRSRWCGSGGRRNCRSFSGFVKRFVSENLYYSY